LIADVMMPGLNGLEVARRVSKASPGTRVIILSMYMDEPYVVEALQNGAFGYVLKESDISELIKAIREVTAGHRYLGPPLSELAIEVFMEKTRGVTLDLYNTLTAREREVLQLVIDGLTSPKIASMLFISTRTVESHRARLMKKLSIKSRDDLIKYAMKKGLYRKAP
jgi:two-component system, NarL family, response regulator NreC